MNAKQYIQAHASMFGGPDESLIECQSVKIVTVRYSRRCCCPANTRGHELKAGEKAVCDRAIVDGLWGASYTCLPCLESWEKHITKHSEYCTVCESNPLAEELSR